MLGLKLTMSVKGAPEYIATGKQSVKRQRCGIGDPSFLRKRGRYFKKNCTYLVSLCLHEQVGDTILAGWPQFECNCNVFADMILPYGSHCIQMTASPRTYQRRYRTVTCHQQPRPWPAASPPASAWAREVRKLRHVTSVGKSKCFPVQLVLVQQRNFRLQITIAR